MTLTKEETQQFIDYLKYAASHPDGRGHVISWFQGWAVFKSGARRILKKFSTKEEAIQYATEKKSQGLFTGIVLHRTDGRFDREIM